MLSVALCFAVFNVLHLAAFIIFTLIILYHYFSRKGFIRKRMTSRESDSKLAPEYAELFDSHKEAETRAIAQARVLAMSKPAPGFLLLQAGQQVEIIAMDEGPM